MISVENLFKTFKISKIQKKESGLMTDEIIAVNSISFECKEGEITGLLGPNGAGKTTTLRILATLLKPTSGSVIVNNFDVLKNENEVRKSIGFLTGSTALYPRLTPNEIIDYVGYIYGLSPRLLKERKKKYFDLLDINFFADKQIDTLSTGMKQKVSIVRTIIHDPKVVIFDEPTSGLDVISAEHIINLISDCKMEGKTVILSSHIMSEVNLLCDNLVVINKGIVCYKNEMKDFRYQAKANTLTQEFINIIKNKNNNA